MGSFRFCRSCQFDFDEQVTTPPAAAVPVPIVPPVGAPASNTGQSLTPAQLVLGGGIAWIVCALFIGYLSLQQLGVAGTIDTLNRVSEALGGIATTGTGDLRTTALLNAFVAVVTVYFGIKMIRTPNRTFLVRSMLWAAINIIWNGYSIANGVSDFAFLGATIAAIAAGVFSYAAWQSTPANG